MFLAAIFEVDVPILSDDSALPDIPHWLSVSTWRQCEYLTHHLDPFSTLCDSLLSSEEQWKEFCNSNNLYEFLKSPYRGEDLLLQEGKQCCTNLLEYMPNYSKCPVYRLAI